MIQLIEINSYLLRPKIKITNLNDALKYPDKYFILLDALELQKYKKGDYDREYLDGVITIAFNGTHILNFDKWDLVDQLWSYFINLFEDLIKNGFSETYFPDQPLKITLQDKGKHFILLSIDQVNWTLPKKDFIVAMLNEAERFFLKIMDFFDDLDYKYEINRILELREKIR